MTLRNAKIDMYRGSMRLAVDQWGKVEALEGSSFQPKVRTSGWRRPRAAAVPVTPTGRAVRRRRQQPHAPCANARPVRRAHVP